MDYQDIISYHHQKDADMTIGFVQVDKSRAHRFGIAEIDNEDGDTGGRVKGYWEKPDKPEADWASLTVLIFKPEILFKALHENQVSDSFEFGKDIIPQLMKQGKRIYGYKYRGYWGYTGTIEEYWQSNMDLLGDNPPIDMEAWGLRTNMEHRGIRDAQPALLYEDAQVHNSLVYNGCVVEGTVKNSILFPGVYVEKGAVVENSVLFFNNHIGANCNLNKVISDVNSGFGQGICVGSEIGADAGNVTVIGWNNHVPDWTRIGEGATIYPNLHTEQWPLVVKPGEILK
jgi:glucose-1-phosphate adenylyltransferase